MKEISKKGTPILGSPDFPTIFTWSEFYFDYSKPFENRINIEDIAAGLSNTCRFAGQCHWFYSVAEHSVLVSHVVPDEYAMIGLLHDAAEGYVGDVPAPLKQLLPDFRRIEDSLQQAIWRNFDIIPSEEAMEAVHEADLAMLKLEQKEVMGNKDRWYRLDKVKPADTSVSFWSPHEAREEFLARFKELSALTQGAD